MLRYPSALNPSSTVRKIGLLWLNDLRKDESLLALHFLPGRYSLEFPQCRWYQASVLSPKYEVFCCDQNGPPARREEGAYLNRYVTDEQRSRRPIFIATLWAGASWLFFRVARSTRMIQIWALRSRLEKQPTDLRQNTSYFGDRTLASSKSSPCPATVEVEDEDDYD